MNTRFLNILFHWLPLGVTVVALHLFIYAAVQQNYRSSLNYPQVQMVEDGASALVSGKVPADIVPRTPLFDIGKSLAPFIAVFDAKGKSLESSGMLASSTLQPPLGVLEAAKTSGENRVTWQPNPATRIALVVKYIPEKSLYVIAGRNMREVEGRIDSLTDMLTLFLIGTLAVTFLLDWANDAWRRRVVAVNEKNS